MPSHPSKERSVLALPGLAEATRIPRFLVPPFLEASFSCSAFFVAPSLWAETVGTCLSIGEPTVIKTGIEPSV